jgi:iron complex transport system substrate-binding protein
VVIAAQAALAEMPSRPGWAALAALRNGRGCAVPPARWDTLVRSGPRLAEAADVIADCLTQPARGGPALPLAAGQR